MLQFKQSDTSAVLILTLTENISINDPYFLFVFTHVLTKEQVKFVRAQGADGSLFPARYNAFTINPSIIFLDAPIGQYNYKIYEQVSSSNIDEGLAGSILEYGKLILDRAVAFVQTIYNEETSYSTYNG